MAYHIARIVSTFYSIDYLIRKVNRTMTKYEDEDTEYVFPYGGAYPNKDIMPKRMIEELTVGTFENREVLIFKDYDYYQ